MLKWTASANRTPQDTPVSHRASIGSAPRTSRLSEARRRQRRATIANKENIPIITSTPMVNRTRNSPLVLAPLADILNVTPEAVATRTPERRRVSIQAAPVTNTNVSSSHINRRHSTMGFAVPAARTQYATTLPKFEEEYSPSTVLPSGQQLALRGLLPDPFVGNHRYFSTPEVEAEKEMKKISSDLPKKRKLEQEFIAIAQEERLQSRVKEAKKDFNNTGLQSNTMGDQTLDHLIDAILDSARKEEKKKKPRKSFNLRRRTLLKNQVDTVNDLILSPSYAAGDDPCSDLNFLNCESQPFKAVTPQPASPILDATTPLPLTPNAGTPLNAQALLEMPTPSVKRDSFSLDTPVRPTLKRRSYSRSCQNNSAKKYKVDSRNYFEIGVALPSIYV